MKKACLLHKFSFLGIMCVIACLSFLTSCGIDTYIVVEAPTQTINAPSYSSIEHSDFGFEFWTYETPFQNQDQYPSDFKFLGTEVYYKIYSSSSTMTSEVSSLQSLASSTTTSASAPTKLIENYKYKSLKSTNYTSSPLVKPSEDLHNQRVYIRLTDYQSADEYSSKITVGGEYLGGSTVKTSPLRNSSEVRTFNFGRKGNSDKVPASDEEDVNNGSSSSDGKWYVAMFAVALGRDVTYTTYYSNILYLGSVMIDSETEDN